MQARNIGVLCLLTLVVGCDGNAVSNSDSGVNTPVNASPGGIWQGTDSTSGLDVLGLIDEAGQFRLIRGDNVQYIGTTTVSGNSISGNIVSLPDRGTTFPDGSTHGTGSIVGTVIARQTLNLNIASQTDNGTSTESILTLVYDSTYESKSTLAGLSGEYVEVATGAVFTVDTSGHFSATEAASGCVVTGTVSIINPDYNVYGISYVYSSCGGVASVLNGLTATGMASFTNLGVAAQVVSALSYSVSGQPVGLVVDLNRM